ncbi:hypothetical protein AGR13a_Lc110067 [Agrobacterium genomosp. 13 str. CFBP 6927]|uniref:Uncharacterized protein n=1 Tax=Agrobacterium genomosp. 13 str. CFBP 6927 TaxID=1183428 RepID=A0ABP2BQL2_9HYPH|nr:hypothetical protein AGR13a_Lc110067 [Agrobacterium genomosp. 13 str. CFBP 6927]
MSGFDAPSSLCLRGVIPGKICVLPDNSREQGMAFRPGNQMAMSCKLYRNRTPVCPRGCEKRR